MMKLLQEYKPALIFLAKYVGVYLVLNSVYAWYVESYKPAADPVTLLVTRNCAEVISWWDSDVTSAANSQSSFVPILKRGETVIEVFEGCNSINVIIVFTAFLIAFAGPWRKFWQFLLVGSVSIYLINILRVIGLYLVALYFPESLYFFHKFFFTGIIYFFVFGLWYLWIWKNKQWKSAHR